MELRFDGKIALVTGASSGIGQGIAQALADAGADIAINYRTDADGAEVTARRVRETGHRALTVQADVGEPQQVAAMFDRIDAELGSLDILVANAGHSSAPKPLHETTWAEWDRVLRSNLDGTFLCGQDFLNRGADAVRQAGFAERRLVERVEHGRVVINQRLFLGVEQIEQVAVHLCCRGGRHGEDGANGERRGAAGQDAAASGIASDGAHGVLLPSPYTGGQVSIQPPSTRYVPPVQ